MNKLVIVFFLLVSNCSLLMPDSLKDAYKSQLPSISDPVEGSKWTYNYLSYDIKYWTARLKNPSEICMYKSGVCGDFCVILMYILHNAGQNPQFILAYLKRGGLKHTLIRLNNNYYDPINELYTNEEIKKYFIPYGYITFDEMENAIFTGVSLSYVTYHKI